MKAEVTADATVLIYLAKLDRLSDLRDSYGSVVIPPAVHNEVVVRGKEIGATDAPLVAQAIDEGWISVMDAERNPSVTAFDLEDGEAAVLSLALALGHEEVLADEESVREVARLHGLRPRGTLRFLFDAIRDGSMTFDDFVEEIEDLLENGFYLDEAIYLEAIRSARRLASDSR